MAKLSSQKRKRKHRNLQIKPPYYFWLLQLLIIFSCIGTAYIFWLDYQIRNAFEGKKWSLPARVYASPLEIYPGQSLSQHQLEQELIATGFKRNNQLNKVGQYRITQKALEFAKRSFTFWDGEDPNVTVKVAFKGNSVEKVINLVNDEIVNLVRLEPQLIGKIYPEHNEDRILVSYDDVPDTLIKALIAVEDRHFPYHYGIDFRGILRALFTNLRKGEISQGGSTLTQQLVKNFFLTPDRTFWRKFNEMIMAILLEIRYSKSEILLAYINEIYLGQHGARAIHGFGTAAEFYFASPLNELNVDQIALLVGLVRGASYYNPRRHSQRALDRRNLVVHLMQQQDLIDAKQALSAQSKPLNISQKPAWGRAKYPAFMDIVRRQLLRDYKMQDLQNEGLRIFTTLEPHVQERAQYSARKRLTALEKLKSLDEESLQMAAIIVRTGTGEIVAVIGGRNDQLLGFNRVVEAKRPIGSLIKPVIYLTALSMPDKYNPLTLINDEPISIKQDDGRLWQPRNYDRISHGPVPLITALKYSYNQASVRLGMEIGINAVLDTLYKSGINTKIKAYPSLLLGSLELSPIEVAQLYQTIANGGFQTPLNSIRAVLDSSSKPLQRYRLKVKQSLETAPVFLLNFLLSEVVKDGTARSLTQTLSDSQPLAGKTGTTNDLRDSWFVGYGDDLLGVTWIGRDDNKPSKFSGSSGALWLWSDIMNSIGIQALNLIPPEGIEWTEFGQRQNIRACASTTKIPYIKGFGPVSAEDCHTQDNRG